MRVLWGVVSKNGPVPKDNEDKLALAFLLYCFVEFVTFKWLTSLEKTAKFS